MTTPKSASDKHFRCTICQRGFTRIDHLKRHHLRHSGIKPYSCIFCNESFARCDNLRDHYPDCSQRGDRQIPETGQRGRRRHACESCTSMKLRCDGESPCSSCVKRNLQCNNQRRQTIKTNADTPKSASSSLKPDEYDQSFDRGSIKFLLNGGTDSFTEEFQLPPRSDRARGMVYNAQLELEQPGNETNQIFPYLVDGNASDYNPAFLEPIANMSFLQENFMTLMSGPLGEVQKILQDPAAVGMTPPGFMPMSQEPKMPIISDPMYEPERPFATTLIQSILAKVWTLNLDAKAQQEISQDLHFLLNTSRIRRFINLYFRYWHPNAPMLHLPSFDPEHVLTPLLAAVVFMGAMYSTEDRESFVARRLLDFVELYIFSTDIFSAESDVARAYQGRSIPDEQRRDWLHFQNFQAGYIVMVVQYWSGSQASRNRAMETRFGEILRAARSMGLFQCRHTPADRDDEVLWIQVESRIRTINIIIWLDCAFSFYQNYPCRVSFKEMECYLPGDDFVFNSDHPFAHPDFRWSRSISLYDAFESLFSDGSITDRSAASGNPNGLHFTVFDMFTLIHLLYAFINTHMTLLAPFVAGTSTKQTVSATAPDSNPCTDGQATKMPEDSILAASRSALARWRTIWVHIRTQISDEKWAATGFYKNSYNYWLVAHLLVTKMQGLHVTMNMRVKCDDKLEQLKVLLQDE